MSVYQAGTTPQQSPEEELRLLQRLQAGDAAAFETLFQRYSPKVSQQALHLLGNASEAEEVLQEVFLAVYEKAHTFRGDAAFSTWLYRLTANAALSRLRYHRRHPHVSMDDHLPSFREDGHHLLRPVVDWSSDLESDVAMAEVQRLLRQAIETLAPLDKAVVIMSDLEELSNRDIGNILGLSVPAVKARLHRARLCLRGHLTTALGHAR